MIPLLAAAATLGCSDDTGDSSGLVERDSAGFRIIENGRGLAAAERWSVAPQPHVVIGAGEDSSQQLYSVYAAALLADGRVAIANGGSNQLRVFDATGAFIGSIGRDGEGPGEFRNLLDVWAGVGDTLYAWDYQLRRLSVFDADGEFERSVQPPAGRPSWAYGILDDGSVVVSEQLPASTLQIGRIAENEIELLRHHPSREVPDTLGRYPHSRAVMFETPSGSVGARPLPFAPFITVDVAGRRVAVIDGRSAEARIWDAADARVMLVRWSDAPRAVSSDDMTRYEEEQLAAATDPAMRARMRERIQREQYSDFFPTVERVLLERDGHLWIEHWREPWATGAGPWSVFDPTGRLRATIDVPAGVRVLDIRGDLLVGRVRDEQDVEQVRIYRIGRRP